MTQPAPDVTTRYVPARQPPRRSPLRRPGCIAMLIVWFGLLLAIPIFLFSMLTAGEISVTTGDAPDQRARLWLISNIRERGFGYSNAWVASRSETGLCVQTDVRYWLWQGSQEPSAFCECYDRVDGVWNFVSTTQGACSP
jgi:hypothetical protein